MDRDSALLFFTLGEPAPLPGYVFDTLGAQAGPALARLVADHVLEVELEEGYASGIEALQSLEPGTYGDHKGSPGSPCVRGSAICERVSLLKSSAKLASLIYGYNRLPLTPRWQQSLLDADSTRSLSRLATRW